jgi:cyclophilin family peptidyl-prolyl cis-trans isomerase
VVEGACGPVTQGTTATDAQVTFSCKVGATGPIVPRIYDGSGTQLASLRLDVPKPQLRMAVAQGDRSGTFLLELDANAAPITVTNFLNLVAAGFYTNTIFHRVVPGKLAQGGGFVSNLTLKTGVFTAIKLESNNGLKNLRGTIAMARSDAPDSATTQFYLNLADNAGFDYQSDTNPGYAVFGTVISGMDVVDEIGKVDLVQDNTTFPNLPLVDVTITSVTRLK